MAYSNVKEGGDHNYGCWKSNLRGARIKAAAISAVCVYVSMYAVTLQECNNYTRMRQAKPSQAMHSGDYSRGFSPCHECKKKAYSTREHENRAAKRRDEESIEVRRRRLRIDCDPIHKRKESHWGIQSERVQIINDERQWQGQKGCRNWWWETAQIK